VCIQWFTSSLTFSLEPVALPVMSFVPSLDAAPLRLAQRGAL
jgi:hypothetical protein